MRKLGAVAIAVVLLFGTALYYHFASEETSPPPNDEPTATSSPDTDAETPTTRRTREGTLDMEAAISHAFVRSGTTDTLYGTIDLEATAFEGGERPPLNVALVVDRSGSMHGAKIKHVKKAARTIVGMLEHRDRLAVVSYGGSARLDAPSQRVTKAHRTHFRNAIDRIRESGGTNIAEGLRTGIDEVESHGTEQTVDRVILLSDGKPTVGMSDRDRFESLVRRTRRNGDVTLTTMGVGLDYNEDLMTTMANVGGGNYHFIDRPEKAVSIFEGELEGLAHTVARDTSLVIKLGDGVELRKLHGYPHRTEGDRIYVSLSEVAARESKSVFVELETRWGDEATRPAMEIGLNYEDLVRERPVHESVTLRAKATSQTDRIAASTNDGVISRVQQIEVAESLDRAMEAYESGERSRAKDLLEQQTQKIQRAKRRYDFEQGETFDRVRKDLSEMKKTIERTPSKSARGQTIIKRNKAKGNRLMMDESAFKDF